MIGPGGLSGFQGSVAAGSVPLVDQRPRRAIQAAPTGAFEAGDDVGGVRHDGERQEAARQLRRYRCVGRELTRFFSQGRVNHFDRRQLFALAARD